MKPRKTIDCVEMKQKIQERIHEETKDLSTKELIAYYRRHAETGPFARLWKKPGRKAPPKSTVRRRPTRPTS